MCILCQNFFALLIILLSSFEKDDQQMMKKVQVGTFLKQVKNV